MRIRQEEEEHRENGKIEKRGDKKIVITERRWRNLNDNFEDGKEDKHWEEMKEEGEQEKRNEKEKHMTKMIMMKLNKEQNRTKSK